MYMLGDERRWVGWVVLMEIPAGPLYNINYQDTKSGSIKTSSSNGNQI